jgi:hypothetical protein
MILITFITMCIYVGGHGRAHTKGRKSGETRLGAAYDAIFWPTHVGARLIERCWSADR